MPALGRAPAMVLAVSIAMIGMCIGSVSAADTLRVNARCSTGTQRYWVEEIVRGLRFPTAVAWMPSGDMLISEREGDLRVVRNGALDPKALTGVPSAFKNVFNGLKDIALDPDYEANGHIYILISEGDFDRHHAAILRAKVSRTGLTDVERIFSSGEDLSGVGPAAGRMLILDDKTLLFAVPEDNSHKKMAQRLESSIGKIFRIKRDGTIPEDNPFANAPNARAGIWSYGHRVTTGLYQDPDDGSVWEVEAGPMGGDELNVLKRGGNFGWAQASWGFEYEQGVAAFSQLGAGIEQPVLIWMPWKPPSSPTPSGITRYRGRTYCHWSGDFFVGFLAGKAVERIRIVGRDVLVQEKLLTDLNERIRDIKVGPDNHIYVLTDHPNGRLLRINPGQPRGKERNRVARGLEQRWDPNSASTYTLLVPGDPNKGKNAFIERCSGCHSVGSTVQGGRMGPDLQGVVGRRAGSLQGFNYSPALANSPQRWDFVTLNLFIAGPSFYAPGTTMTAAPVDDEEMRRNIVGFLAHESE